MNEIDEQKFNEQSINDEMLFTQMRVDVDWNWVEAFLFRTSYEDDFHRRKRTIWNRLNRVGWHKYGHTLASLQNPDKSFAFY